MPFFVVASQKYEQLKSLLHSYGSCLVAYSGGVDSVFLAYVAREVLGDKSLAVIADSPSLPRRELNEALEIAQRFGMPVKVVGTHEFENPHYTANPTNRCYFCKHELSVNLEPLAREMNFAVIAYGENASDVGDHRPGAQAAAEFQVRAPLKEVGLTKPEIRELTAELGLPTSDKPQMACLSSRVPYGEIVSLEKLGMIEKAENALRDLGFRDVRVRHHELLAPQAPAPLLRLPGLTGLTGSSVIARKQHLARIEVGPSEFRKLLEDGISVRIAETLKAIGYAHVTLDLLGYRRGSMNEVASGAMQKP